MWILVVVVLLKGKQALWNISQGSGTNPWWFTAIFLKIMNIRWNSYSFVLLQNKGSDWFKNPYHLSDNSIWKNQVRWTWFLICFEVDFYCLCSLQKSNLKLIFAVSRELYHLVAISRSLIFMNTRKYCNYISKRKGKYFYTFNHFHIVKSKIAQSYYYDPQSAGINMQSPQSRTTPRRLTLTM